MQLRISRSWLIVIAFLLTFAGFFWQRIHVYRQSEFVQGVLLNDDNNELYFTGEIEMNLYYFVGHQEFCVKTYQYPKMENAIVTVRYIPTMPAKGQIYTVADFWFISMLWLILPLMVLCALIISFLDENSNVEFFIHRHKKNL